VVVAVEARLAVAVEDHMGEAAASSALTTNLGGASTT
jgi:hypothetical protein